MQRFGRTANQRIKDRWGGGFILVTILALLAAWYGGGAIGDVIKNWGNRPASGTGSTSKTDSKSTGTTNLPGEPGEFQLRFVQVGAFRSAANARTLAGKLAEKEYSAMVTPKQDSNLQMVWVGPFMDAQAANQAKSELTKDFPEIKAVTVNVVYNPDALPVAALGAKQSDVKTGLETLNTYIHEVAVWLDNRALDPKAAVTDVKALGKTLQDLATKLNNESDVNAKAVAALCATASANAMALEMVAAGSVEAADYQSAMTDYLALVNQYNALHTDGK